MKKNKLLNILTIFTASLVLTGCNSLVRLSELGREPELSQPSNPIRQPNYEPVSMPMPLIRDANPTTNSLWRPGSKSFFKDLRANDVGDIVTVLININDNANLQNSTEQTRESTLDLDTPSVLGLAAPLADKIFNNLNPVDPLDVDSETDVSGAGTIQRNETVNLQVAAVITQVLPNGNLVIHGRQETRVNFEVRELQVAGVIQPQDITNQNTISYQDIAEARVSYGGRGSISNLQQPKIGTQLIDIILPF